MKLIDGTFACSHCWGHMDNDLDDFCVPCWKIVIDYFNTCTYQQYACCMYAIQTGTPLFDCMYKLDGIDKHYKELRDEGLIVRHGEKIRKNLVGYAIVMPC